MAYRRRSSRRRRVSYSRGRRRGSGIGRRHRIGWRM